MLKYASSSISVVPGSKGMKVKKIGGGTGKKKQREGTFKSNKKDDGGPRKDGKEWKKKENGVHKKDHAQNGHMNGYMKKFGGEEDGKRTFPKKKLERNGEEFGKAPKEKSLDEVARPKKKFEKKGGDYRQPKNLPVVKHREGQKWYEYQIDAKVEDATKDKVSDEEQRKLAEESDLLLRTDADLYNQLMRVSGGGEAAWLQTIAQRGTHGDKQTALTLQIRNSPVHSVSAVGSLVHSVERKNVREAMELIPQLEELFIQDLLPPNRKLFSFGSRPLARLGELSSQSVQAKKRILVLWRFEHELKILYERFTKALLEISGMAVENLCVRCLQAVQNLLAERPEQEQFLLTLLVNKMGHPNKKVAARCESFLGELTRRQMNMRPIIVTEVERLIYRRNVSETAQHHAAKFLSQLILRPGESDLAANLLTIYFGLFKTLVAQRRTENKLVAILLSGANRAFPYAKDKADSLSEDIDALYRLVHQAPFGVALQTLKLLHHVLNLSDSLSDRFYSALYRKLLEHAPPATQHQLLDLLWKTLKGDQIEQRVRAFVKRLLQVATVESAPFAAGILLMVSRLLEDRPALIVVQREPQSVLSVSGLKKKKNDKRSLKQFEEDEEEEKRAMSEMDDDDEEEHYVDLDDDGRPLARGAGIKVEKREDIEDSSDDEIKEVSLKKKEEKGKKPMAGTLPALNTQGWVHRKNNAHHSGVSLYDSSARNPLFISCEGAFDSELRLLSQHYHPSVGVFANSVLSGKTVNYGGDPLTDFTSIAFLDRFVFRNPKTTAPKKGATHKRVATGVRALPISSAEYITKRKDEIPADERFIHRFATIKFAEKAKEEKKEKGEEDWDDIESVNSDEFEEVMARFEPGEANDNFDIDFSKEFTMEKQKKGQKRKAADEDEGDGEVEKDDDGEDDNLSMDDMDDMEDDDDEDGGEEEDEEDEDDDDLVIEGQESDEDLMPKQRRARFDGESDEEDQDYGDNDAFVSADQFAEMMEDFGDGEETREERRQRMKKKTPKVNNKGAKKRKG